MTGGVWIISYLLLWAAVVVLGFSVVVLLRQIGVLHTRVAPMGVHFAGEGPELDTPAPALDDVTYGDDDLTLVAFTSPTCEICDSLKPGLRRLADSYGEVGLHVVDHADAPDTFARFEVRSTPYLVAVDADGIVRSRGVANTLDQAEEMVAEVLVGPPIDLDLKLGASAPSSTSEVVHAAAAAAAVATATPAVAPAVAVDTASAEAEGSCGEGCGCVDTTDTAATGADTAASNDAAETTGDEEDLGLFGTDTGVVVLP